MNNKIDKKYVYIKKGEGGKEEGLIIIDCEMGLWGLGEYHYG